MLTNVADWQGNAKRSLSLSEEALVLARDFNDESLTLRALNNLGYTAYLHGDLERARPALEEALNLARRMDDTWGLGNALHGVGEVHRAEGDFVGAVAAYREGIALAKENEAWISSIECLEGLAAVAVAQGLPEHATRMLAVTQESRRVINFPIEPAQQRAYQGVMRAVREALSEETFRTVWEAGKALSLEEAVAEALAVAEEHFGKTAETGV